MTRTKVATVVAAMVASLWAGVASANVVIAVQNSYISMPGNNLFYAWGYDPVADEIVAATSSNSKSVRRIRIVDADTNGGLGPWIVENPSPDPVLDALQLIDFGKNGSPLLTGGDHSLWGAEYCPANGRYFITLFGSSLMNGAVVSDMCARIAMFDPKLHDGVNATVNTNGYPAGTLYDGNATFVTDGVAVGDRMTIVGTATAAPGTYTVTSVLDQNALQLDSDPGSSTKDVRYYLSIQRWVSHAALKALTPSAYTSGTSVANPAAPGAVSPDGSTFYFRENLSNTVMATSTTTPETPSVFVPQSSFVTYIAAQTAAGRTMAKTGAAFNSANGKVNNEIATAPDGKVFFSEIETDDLLWTTDGTLHTFLTSNAIYAYYLANGLPTAANTGVYVQGVHVDKMGTVYWSDVTAKGIHKCAAVGDPQDMRLIATSAEITAAGASTTGLSPMQSRGTKLLMDAQYRGTPLTLAQIIAVDMKTWQYGDFDQDVDVDVDDYALFEACMAGPGVSTPPGGCTSEMFGWADLDDDIDVDLDDYSLFQKWHTGPL